MSAIARALTALVLLAMAVQPVRAQAAPSDSVLRGFERSGIRLLIVNGQEDKKAEIYLNENIPAYLILPGPASALSPILLSPGAKTIETVSLAKVVRQKDGSADVLADADLKPQGSFRMEGDKVVFTSEGKAVALAPSPPLLGLKTNADLKAHSPEYARLAQSYAPQAAALQALQKVAKPATVRVYFGSWCPFCRAHVPLLLKVEDQLRAAKAANTSKIRFEYVGMPHDFNDPEMKRLNIKTVPTAIISVDGREIGRMQAADWDVPEATLAKLLAASP
jgi:thiol-disulfide isomerase/thioredoxin